MSMLLVAIGGSAGSIEALRELLRPLRRGAARYVIAIHVAPSHPSLLADVLGHFTELRVREAVDKLPLEPGMVVVAPPDYHLLVERGPREPHVALSRDPAVHFSRPAIDPLFESVAHAARHAAIAVLLSGGNEDGAAGLVAVKRAGGRIAVQDPRTASSPAMPSAALARCTPDLVAAPAALGAWLSTLTPLEA